MSVRNALSVPTWVPDFELRQLRAIAYQFWVAKVPLIAGAALGVYVCEPEVRQDLLTLENVVLAPHLGSATTETRTAMADLAARNAIAVLSGEPPLTPVP